MPRIIAGLFLLGWVSTGWAHAPDSERLWSVVDGSTTLSFDLQTMEKLGLRVAETDETAVASIVPGLALGFSVDPGSTLVISVGDDRQVRFVAGEVRHIGGISFGGSGLSSRLFDFGLAISSTGQDGNLQLLDARSGEVAFDVSGGLKGWNPITQQLTIARARISINDSWAQDQGRPDWSGRQVGTLDSILMAELVDRTTPLAPVHTEVSTEQQRAVNGPDVTQCRHGSLFQWGREGSIVGLASTTTSLNVGDEPMDWFANPNVHHPFIVMNLYRLLDDRFEQIGQSWIKHGFFATNTEECGAQSNCIYPGSGNLLGIGCTDTYGSQLNAMQSVLGPRGEVNGWTGEYVYTGSHQDIGAGGHSPIDHRLQVHDDDLDPALNPGAQYFSEAYYVSWDDVDHTNNVVWKEVTRSGAPLGTWTFSMSGLSTPPKTGASLGTWGGKRTVIGGTEEPYNNPAADNDGRCYVHYKIADLGAGQYGYEYAIFNLDMDRGLQSFSVPIPPNVTVSNADGHYVASHGEGLSNAPWDIAIGVDSITFSCDNYATDPNANALRWGTLYNFRFEADAGADYVTATFGLFKPGPVGDPDELTGTIQGPSNAPVLTAAVSRLVHGPEGPFDFGLVDGEILENRIPGPSQLVVSFDQEIDPATLAVAINGINSGVYGGVANLSLGAGNTELTIDLDPRLATQDRHTVDLTGLAALSTGQPLQNPVFTVAVLSGDVSRDEAVTTGDASQTIFFFNRPADSGNFQFDVDADGVITTGDFSQIIFFFNNSLP